jgi:teichuronic acid biosynthesis glycosyltransferase TuaH
MYKNDIKEIRILYLMHVDWGWAKQRPHFIAESLSNKNNVLVTYPYYQNRKWLVKNKKTNIRSFPIRQIPFYDSFKFFNFFNFYWNSLINLFLIISYRPQIIWITSPELSLNFLRIGRAKIVYDCMDDIAGFKNDPKHKSFILKQEQKLISLSSLVFCSSSSLLDLSIRKYNNSEKFILLNNAFNPDSFDNFKSNSKFITNKNSFKLGYFGTIADWIDFSSLIKLLYTFNDIEIHLIGPIEQELNLKFNHPRLMFYGPIAHHELPDKVQFFDLFIMPFIVTDLILSVDPVKFYEYIYFNKPIVSIQYPEIQRFDKFVDFYSNYLEFESLVNLYLNEGKVKKYEDKERDEFILNNTWNSRTEIIQEYIQKVLQFI